MAKQLNKRLVIGLTIGGMVITTIAGVVMVATLPEKDPQYYVKQAKEASAAGEHLKASKLYGRAWKVANDARYLVDCGQEALDSGDVHLARKVWSEAIMNDPKLEPAHQKIVELNLEIAKLSRGVTTWEQVRSAAESLLKVNPKNSIGLHARGLARLGLRGVKEGNEKQGVEDLIEAHKLAPENPEYADSLAQYSEDRANQYESDAQKADAEAQRLESQGQREAAASQREEARTARTEAGKEYEEAEGIYRAAVDSAVKYSAAAAQTPATTTQPTSETPGDKAATAHRNCGMFLLRRAVANDIPEAQRRSRLDEGLKELQKAVALAPEEVDNYVALGSYWVQREGVERRIAAATSQPVTTTRAIRAEYAKKAEEALIKSLEVGPNEYTNYLALGMLYNLQGDPKAALKVYDQRLDRAIVRASYLRWQDRHFKLVLLDQAFRTALQQLTGRPENKEADDALIAKAESYYRKVVAEAPAGESDPAALAMKGRIEAVRGNSREAIRTLELAEKRLPTNHPALPEIRFVLGDLYARVGETGAAQQALQNVVQSYPENDEAWARLASVLSVNKDRRGVQAAQQALRINPNNRTALAVMADTYTQEKNWEKAKEMQRRLQAGQPEDSEATLFMRARGAILEAYAADPPDTEKIETAKRLLRQIVEKAPTNLRALAPLAQLLVRDKQNDEVKELLDKALAAAKTSPPKNRAELEQGIQLLRVSTSPGKTPAEIAQATEELLRKGKYEDEFAREMDLVQFYLQSNDFKQSVEHAKKAAAMRPKDSAITDVLFRLALANNDEALAKETMKRAAEGNLDGAQGHFYIGRHALATNDAARAIQEFRTGLEIAGTSSLGQALLGRALLAAGRYDEAHDAFAKAVALNPNSGGAVLGLAQLAEFRNQPEVMAQYLARAKDLAPTDPWVQQKLQEEQEAKDPEKAIVAREAQRKNIPSDPQKLELAHIANLVRLAALYVQAKPPRFDKAEEVFKEAFQKSLTNERLKSRAVVWAYATFLRQRTDKPEPERGLELLKTYAQSLKTKDEQAAAQLLVAQHLQEWARLGLPNAPTRADIDAVYTAATNIAEPFELLMGAGTWYRQTQRVKQADEFYRKAVQKATGGPDAANRERMARRYQIEALEQSRDVERRDEIDGLIAEYMKRFPDDPAGLLFRGQQDILTGRDNEAIAAYSKYLEKDPSGALAYFRRGYLWFRQEKWDAAIEDLQKAKTLSPAGFNYEHRLLLGNAMLQKGEPDAAINELEAIIREDPQAELVARQLVSAYASLQRLDQAEARALAFRQQFPTRPFWPYRLGQIAEERARRTNDPIRKGEFLRTAIQHYRTAVDVSKYAPDAIARLVKLMLSSGQFDDVIEYITRTLPADKRNAETDAVLGAAYLKKGQSDEARKAFHIALTDAKTSPLALRFVVESLQAAAGPEAAMQIVKDWTGAPPDSWPGKYALAVLYSRVAEESRKANRPEDAKAADAETEKALREAMAAAKEKEERVGVMRSLAQFLYAAKRFDEAAKLSAQILEIVPEDVVTLNNLAYMLMADMNKPKESLEYAKHASVLSPDNPNVLDTYGWNLALLGRYADAIAPLSAAADAEPDNSLVRYHRAFTYKKLSENKTETVLKALDLAKADANHAYDLAVKTHDADTMKLCTELLKEMGITPDPPPAASPTTPTAK